MRDITWSDFTTGEGEAEAKEVDGLELFGSPVPTVLPVVVWESLEFADPEQQRRWDALSEEERAQYIRVVKEMIKEWE